MELDLDNCTLGVLGQLVFSSPSYLLKEIYMTWLQQLVGKVRCSLVGYDL